MAWRYLPHQLNNRKFSKAVVFVPGSSGGANSWIGAPNRFVDRLSRVPAVYNHIGLYAFGYDPKHFTVGGVGQLVARIPAYKERTEQKAFEAGIRKVATELHLTMAEMLPGVKTVVLVGQGLGNVIIKRVLGAMGDTVQCHYIDLDDAADESSDSALTIDDPTTHVGYNKVLAFLVSLLAVEKPLQ
jgi:hypothetical protein